MAKFIALIGAAIRVAVLVLVLALVVWGIAVVLGKIG